ncbi:MAG: CDP-glucose 4,6-dehydratase [Bacteroidia bacterium]|nr:CDP-glucose 4,6-dehydratase [Bacteroidia bacterium]
MVKNTIAYYKGKKVFVTGHTGFKGAWFITWLHLMGATVKGYALVPENEACLFNIVKGQFEFENIIDSILNKERLQKEIEDFNPDFIFHLAAQALVRRSYEIPAETFDVNVTGTANVLEAATKIPGKCTIVCITTDKVYENKEIDYNYKEDDVLGGYDPYSASKAAAEIVISSFRKSFFNPQKHKQHQKALASVRAGNVIGGGDWNKDRIIPDIIRSLKKNSNIDVRNPNAIRPWQHVLEPLGGYLVTGMLLDKDPAKYSGAYNFGPLANDHLPVKDLVTIAISSWGSGKWNDVSDALQPHEAGLLQLDINKATKELNWHPRLTSKEAVQWTIDWYKQKEEDLYAFTISQINNYQQK